MNSVFLILMAVAMIATLGALIIGLVAFVKGGQFNEKHGNKMMRLRLYFQAAAILFFALAAITHVGG